MSRVKNDRHGPHGQREDRQGDQQAPSRSKTMGADEDAGKFRRGGGVSRFGKDFGQRDLSAMDVSSSEEDI